MAGGRSLEYVKSHQHVCMSFGLICVVCAITNTRIDLFSSLWNHGEITLLPSPSQNQYLHAAWAELKKKFLNLMQENCFIFMENKKMLQENWISLFMVFSLSLPSPSCTPLVVALKYLILWLHFPPKKKKKKNMLTKVFRHNTVIIGLRDKKKTKKKLTIKKSLCVCAAGACVPVEYSFQISKWKW